MTRYLFAAPFVGFTILSPQWLHVPTIVQVRKPAKTVRLARIILEWSYCAALYDAIKEALELLLFDDKDN